MGRYCFKEFLSLPRHLGDAIASKPKRWIRGGFAWGLPNSLQLKKNIKTGIDFIKKIFILVVIKHPCISFKTRTRKGAYL